MTAIIVQCRLSSTRLPRKALNDLGGKPVLAWVLDAMRQVPADTYYVATDEESFPELNPVAQLCGWNCFAGPRDDVLKRYCLLIEKLKADIVIRATADNPFLFYEAARSLIEEYRNGFPSFDYVTWTGLPHGSGVELFRGTALIEAEKQTDSPYDHEHVGPALYNHADQFNIQMLPSPKRWNYPSYRTTIDMPADYMRACMIVQQLSGGKAPKHPYTTEQILSAFENPLLNHQVLCMPSTRKGRGTGHLHRCLDIAKSIGAAVFIPDEAGLAETQNLVSLYVSSGLYPWQITSSFPQTGEYSLIFTDMFALEADMARKLYSVAPVVALDEGSPYTDCCDYLLDVIPPVQENRDVNVSEPGFMELPENRRTEAKVTSAAGFKNILISAGGEDPSDLVIPTAIAFAKTGRKVTAIRSHAEAEKQRIPVQLIDKINLIEPVSNLREKLALYDLVVTHYGLTAYEASAAGCAVLLLGTTALHVELARKYGFICIAAGRISASVITSVLENPAALYHSISCPQRKPYTGLSDFVRQLSFGRRFSCPVCALPPTFLDSVVARTSQRTFRRCTRCGTLYMSWTIESDDMSYDSSYFFSQYEQQYGRTYIDDFTTIKAQSVRRTSLIDFLYHRKLRSSTTPAILDIGCAYGPFLDAAADAGWQVYGTDISPEAVEYVQKKLLFPAVCATFPDFDPAVEFGVRMFDAITMWYVIEHFRNLDTVLKTVAGILKPGGIFAFSTPSASGVSARFNRTAFFASSPADHYTLWEPSHTRSVLAKYGFHVVKMVNTGHHPERFPLVKRHGWQKKTLPYAFVFAASHFFSLGDTFEVYCKKTIRYGN